MKTDESYTTSYSINDKVTLLSYLSKYYSTYSQKFNYISYTRLYDNKICKVVTNEENKIREAIGIRKEQQKKKQLSDF